MKIFNKQELADYMGVEIKTVKYLSYRKLIPRIRVGKEYRFLKDDVDQWLKKNRELPTHFNFERLGSG